MLLTRDGWGRLYNHVLALDALYFRYHKVQFDEAAVRRELRKCMAGFGATSRLRPQRLIASRESETIGQPMEEDDSQLRTASPVIATGNWGCGAFKGDRQLKCELELHVSPGENKE